MTATPPDERLSDLVAHAVVLRVRAEELAGLAHRDDIALPDVATMASRIAERAAIILHLAEQLIGVATTTIWG